MTGAKEPEKTPEDGIEVEADFEPGSVKSPGVGRMKATEEIVLEDGAIEVLDEEIEVAAELPARPTQPSPPSTGVVRSRPPMRPSGRPRPSSGNSALPPPRVLSGPPSAWPPSSRPSNSDPWLLANRTLELSRAHARIAELEEAVAFRDARILTLEENLRNAQQRLGDLEQKPSVGRGVPKPMRSAAATRPVVTETRLVAAPVKPAVAPSAVTPSAVTPSAVTPSAVTPAPAVAQSEGATPPATLSAAAPAHATLDAEDEEVDELEDGPVSNAEGGMDAAQPLNGDDVESDLRQISGIGPRFEAALRKQGITRLSQIAAWSDADVRQVAKALKIPKSRIVKGRWIEAAREAIGARVASE